MNKTLSQKAFMRHMAQVTTDAGFTVELVKGNEIHVLHEGQTNRLNLAAAYSAYLNAPNRIDDIAGVHLSVLGEAAKVSAPAQPDGSEMLLPLLQQKSWLDDAKKKVKSVPVNRPFVTGLVVTYVIDTPAFRTYLNEDALEKILSDGEIMLDDVHQSALQNLRTLMTNEMEIESHNSFHEMIITCETREGYASSLVLLSDVMAEWDKKLPGNMLIGIPNRDFIVAFSDQHPSGIEGIEEQTHLDARTRDRPLSGRLLVWKDGQVREHKPLN